MAKTQQVVTVPVAPEARAKALTQQDAKRAARAVAAEIVAEESRELRLAAKRAANARYHARRKAAAAAAAAAPVAATPVVAPAPVAAMPAVRATITLAQYVASLEVLVASTRASRSQAADARLDGVLEGIETALRLARLLA